MTAHLYRASSSPMPASTDKAASPQRMHLADPTCTAAAPLTVWQDLTSMRSCQWRGQIRRGATHRRSWSIGSQERSRIDCNPDPGAGVTGRAVNRNVKAEASDAHAVVFEFLNAAGRKGGRSIKRSSFRRARVRLGAAAFATRSRLSSSVAQPAHGTRLPQ